MNNMTRIEDLRQQRKTIQADALDGERGDPCILVFAHDEETGSEECWMVYGDEADVEITANGSWFFVNGLMVESTESQSVDELKQRFVDCKTERISIGSDD